MFETWQHAQPAGLLPPGRRNFSLQSARIPAKKLLASGPKSIPAGHIANFQTSPNGFINESSPFPRLGEVQCFIVIHAEIGGITAHIQTGKQQGSRTGRRRPHDGLRFQGGGVHQRVQKGNALWAGMAAGRMGLSCAGWVPGGRRAPLTKLEFSCKVNGKELCFGSLKVVKRK